MIGAPFDERSIQGTARRAPTAVPAARKREPATERHLDPESLPLRLLLLPAPLPLSRKAPRRTAEERSQRKTGGVSVSLSFSVIRARCSSSLGRELTEQWRGYRDSATVR